MEKIMQLTENITIVLTKDKRKKIIVDEQGITKEYNEIINKNRNKIKEFFKLG